MYPQVYNPNRHSKVCIHRSITPTGTARYVSTGLQSQQTQQGVYPQVYSPNKHNKVCIHRSTVPTNTRYVSTGIFFSCVFWSSEPFILWWTLVSCGLFFDQVDHSFYWELCRLWSGGFLSKWTIHFTVNSVSCGLCFLSKWTILLWTLSAVVCFLSKWTVHFTENFVSCGLCFLNKWTVHFTVNSVSCGVFWASGPFYCEICQLWSVFSE